MQSHSQGGGQPQPQVLDRQQILPQALARVQVTDLYQNCLKLASENKINKNNTWSLGLIDHLSDLVKPADSEGRSTNFQAASCTLEAGVKIYSYRVDSVHNDAFKTLAGFSRAALPASQDEGEDGEGEDAEGEEGQQGGARRKRRTAADSNPSATLEPSWEALNVKKFDLAFAVDPLFHRMSAQFDEGGARGLLLANLSVFKGCELVFDSADVPEEAVQADQQQYRPGSKEVEVDLSALGDDVAAAVAACSDPDAAICPSLPQLVALLEEGEPRRFRGGQAARVQQLVFRNGRGLEDVPGGGAGG
eukprot:jgi/Astpho2/7927/Aster-x1468